LRNSNLPYFSTSGYNSNNENIESVDSNSVVPGDIVLFRQSNGVLHVGIVSSWNGTNGIFYGSQSTTGPATTSFGANSSYWGTGANPIVGFFRPKSIEPTPSPTPDPSSPPEPQPTPEPSPTPEPTPTPEPSSPPQPPDRITIQIPGYTDIRTITFHDLITNAINNGRTNSTPSDATSVSLPSMPGAPLATPILLDLDGDGIETVGLQSTAYFDHDGNGYIERTGWVGADDGILAVDLNNNGVIDDGTEIFGKSVTPGGQIDLAALRQYDTNSDNKIDLNEAEAANLRVWVDADTDGFSGYDEDELRHLSDAGVAEINLNSIAVNTNDQYGNTKTGESTFVRTDGTSGEVGEYLFVRDVLDTLVEDWVDSPSAIGGHGAKQRSQQVQGVGLKGSINRRFNFITNVAAETIQ